MRVRCEVLLSLIWLGLALGPHLAFLRDLLTLRSGITPGRTQASIEGAEDGCMQNKCLFH